VYVEHVLGGSPVRRSRWRVGDRGDPCVGGREGGRMAGEWVVEGGGRGEGGLHSSNGMREPLSNRCRGGARSPRWLLRTLMSFSLDPLPLLHRRPPPPSGQPPTRRPSRRPPPPSTSRRAPPTAMLPLPPSTLLLAPLFRSFSRRPSSFSRPLLSFRSLRHRERGGHDTSQSTADARSIPTDLGFSFTLYLSLSLPRHFSASSFAYCRQLPSPSSHHPPQPTSPSPFITSSVEHPATNLLRMLVLYARLALNV